MGLDPCLRSTVRPLAEFDRERRQLYGGPVIEEFAKVAPVAAVWWLFRVVRRHWGYTDVVLACAAVGSGFGLAENLLRFGADSGRALSTSGGWFILRPFNPLLVRGPEAMLTAWLPAGAANTSLLGVSSGPDAINVHLVWSTVAGLGLALLLRGATRPGGGWVRLGGLGLIALAGLDHAANNTSAGGSAAQALAEPFTVARQAIWLYPLVALGVAIWLDRSLLAERFRAMAGIRLAAEGPDPGTSALALTKLAVLWPPSSWLAVCGFVRLRRSYLYSVSAGSRPDDVFVTMLGRVGAALQQASLPGGAAVWRQGAQDARARRRSIPMSTRRKVVIVAWLVIVTVPVVYFVIGGLPVFSAVQSWFTGRNAFWGVAAVTGLSGLWTAWFLFSALGRLRATRLLPAADPAATSGLVIPARTGSLMLTITGLIALARGTRAGDPLISNFHLLDALSDAFFEVTLMLAILALFAALPPLAPVLVAAGVGELAATVSAATLANLALGTGAAGIVFNEASDWVPGEYGGTPTEGGPYGEEQPREYSTYNEARDEARRLSGLGDDAVDFIQEDGPYTGRVTGRTNPDGERGWRIDWDQDKGFHVNWWDHTRGLKRAKWRFGANKITDGNEDDFWKLLQHFPDN